MIFSLFGKKGGKNSDDRTEKKARASGRRPGVDRGDSIFETRTPHPPVTTPPTTVRGPDPLEETRRRQAEMTAKIDAIESEMAGEFPTLSAASTLRKPTPVPQGVQMPAEVQREPEDSIAKPSVVPRVESPPTLPPLDMSTDILLGATAALSALEIQEIVQSNPVVEEAAMLFANGQRAECERALRQAIADDPANREAWLLLFELVQQSGNASAFDHLAIEYSVKFETSPPAWRAPEPTTKPAHHKAHPTGGDSHAVMLPASLDAMAVKEIEQARQQLRMSSRVRISLEAVNQADEIGVKLLSDLLLSVRKTSQEITLMGVEQAAHGLRSRFDIGAPQQNEAVWLFVLELYRLLGWEKQFEDLSIEYSVTFEVSPPQFEKPPANIVIGSALPKINVVQDEAGAAVVMSSRPSLHGEVLGRAGESIGMLDGAAAVADHVEIDCAHLLRVDFAAAGALLNWLVSAHARGKSFVFLDVNVLVAALFSVMGIDGVAQVQRRKT